MGKGKTSAFDKYAYLSSFKTSSGKEIFYYSLPALEAAGIGSVSALPFSIRIVLESLLRNSGTESVTAENVIALANWNAKDPGERDVPFKVSRILMQDFTGVPAVVDLGAMRQYLAGKKSSPGSIQPEIPVDLIIDHSVQVDSFNARNAIQTNQKKEMERNTERYKLLKWASGAFNNFRVFPPSAGICHQVNLECLATCVAVKKEGNKQIAFPDTLVGTDSHTTMADALGIVGFGVGGIEAEAAMLGQPISFAMPKVLGVRLKGRLRDGVTATDFALTLTRLLREKGVVNMFVEFFGEGVKNLSLPDRATLSNMCPEYGATVSVFPTDNETLRYMKGTGRDEEQIELIKRYMTAQKMFDIDYRKVRYSDILDVDLRSIEPSVSGPSQPKQQIPLRGIRENFIKTFTVGTAKARDGHKLSSKDYTRWSAESMAAENGRIKDAPLHSAIKSVRIRYEDGYEATLSDGDVVISSITSCTNTSNPSVMVAAGLLAKKAVEKGLKVDTRKVKTSMGPGSRVVVRYLEKAGLMKYLERLGFGLVGFGCITCIGNSGPLIEGQSDAINRNGLAVASVLSGNRNYEARIHRDVRANYLMSPPLLVAFAISGTVLKDLTKEPLGKGKDGKPVYLRDIWPSQKEVDRIVGKTVSERMFRKEYGKGIYEVNPYWNGLRSAKGSMYEWDGKSTYILLPPFFEDLEPYAGEAINPIRGARVLALFGDSISTDHISPAGEIGADTPAGKYLLGMGVKKEDFNTYGSRRGNHEVMVRGTFANNRIKNMMLGGEEGGFTIHYPSMRKMPIYEAAMKYKREKVPVVVIGGAEYGSGSSRDWAAKGPRLLGIKAVIAKSFERIHRSNLVGMGIVPLQFGAGEDANKLGIDTSKSVSIEIDSSLGSRSKVKMRYTKKNGEEASAELLCRIDTEIELEYFRAGGILNYVLKRIMAGR